MLYIIKSGEPHDGLITTKCRCVVHAVFNPTRPHGDRFAVIHEQLNKLFGTRVPVVPHIVALPSQEDLPDLRQALGIAATAVVFARYGGNESFDIPWVQEAVVHVAGRHPEICFVFLNTWRFGPLMPNVLFLAGTSDVKRKVQLIRASSALLHGRGRGETFGLTCGEFASQGKPVITYAGSPEKAHIDILGADKALLYHDRASLTELLLQPVPFWVAASEKMCPNGYTEYTPERVMSAFKKVFLDKGSSGNRVGN